MHTVKEKNGERIRAPVRGAERSYARLMFSFACQKRTRNGSRAGSVGNVFFSRSNGLRSARARGREGGFDTPPPTAGLHSPRNELRAARPFQTPKGLSKPKNASRFAKRIFWASPVYGSADGVTFSQNFMFCKGVKSAAKQQMGETRKKLLAKRPAFFRFDLTFGV